MRRAPFFSPRLPLSIARLWALAGFGALAAALAGVGSCSLHTEGADFDGSFFPTGSGASSSSASSGSGAGGSTEPICAADTKTLCYEGAEGTEDKGVCKGGEKICNGDGLSYGPCIGQIIPTPENCVSAEDEDCDGAPGVCTGDPTWSRRMGGMELDLAIGLTVDLKGNVIVTGYFRGSAAFGGSSLTSKGMEDIFVAKYSPTGGHVWSKSFGGPDPDAGVAVAADAQGNIFVTGQFRNTVDFGFGPFKSGGDSDIFLLKLNPQGEVMFAERFGDDGEQVATAIAVGDDGGPVLAGHFTGNVSFDPGAPTLTSAGDYDIFLTKLGPKGEYQWSQRFGDPLRQLVYAARTGADGRIVIAGAVHGACTFGSTTLTAAGEDAFVAAFDPSGATKYARVFGDALDQQAFAVAVDHDGSAILAGDFVSKIKLKDELTAEGKDIFVSKLDKTGEPLWNKRFGGPGDHHVHALVMDPFGNILLTGSSVGQMSFDTIALSNTTSDVMVAKLKPGGESVFARLFGDAALEQHGLSIGADAEGNLLVGGEFDGTMMFEAPITAAGVRDAFVAKLAP